MFQRKPWHRITAILLSLAMLFSSMPAMAFAETENRSDSEEPDVGVMEQTEEDLEKQLLLEEDVSKENAILEESTENSTVFDLGNGKKMVIYHGQQVRFEDENRTLTDYEPSLIATENSESESGSDLTGYVYENRTGDVKHYMPKQLNGDTPVLMEKDNYSLTMSPYKEKEEKEAIKTKKEPTLTPYEDVKEKKVSAVYEGETITYEYQSMNQGVKETLVLHEVPENNSFSYLITAKGMEAELTEDGAVLFRDKNTEDVAAYIDAPFMNDATGEAYSEDIRTELEEKAEGKYILTYVLDEEYLHDKERVYPVSVDPTATWKGDSKFTDVYVISGSKYADTNFYDSGVRLMPAGKGTDGTYRTYAKLPGLKDTLDGYYVESANLTVYETGDCDKNQTIKVNRVTANWVPSSITWNNKPSHHDTAANSFTTTGTQYKAHQFSVTTMVRNFINSNNHSNYGIVLRNTTSSPGYAEFYGSRTTLTNYRPKLVVTYSAPPTKPTSVSVSKAYLKDGETLNVNWSGITSAGLNHVEYRIAKYNDNGSLANDAYVPWTDLKTTSSSSGSASIDVSSYANLGNYRIYIRGVDGCDNAGAGNYAEFWIDRNRPSYSTIVIKPEGTTESTPSQDLTPEITWEIAEKNVESIKLYMDQESNSGLLLDTKNNKGSYYPSVNSGHHRFMFLTVDKAGNYRYSEWRDYYADGNGPVFEDFKITPDSGTASMSNDATPTISWRISESKLSKVYYSLSGSAYQEAGSTTEGSYTLPTITRDSTYTIKLKAVDAAGNETVSNELTYCLDTTKPTVTKFSVTPDSGTTALTNDTTPTISWSTSEVNISKVLYSVNSTTEYKEAGRASEGTFTLPAISGNGDYVIRLKIVDRAGNVSDIKSQTYCLDATKPVFTAKTIFPQATSDAPTNNTTPTVSWNITETKLNKVYCKIDSATTPERIELSTANSGTAVIPAGKLTTTGEHTIYLQAVDKAGNWSETQALTYYLDVTKPVLGSVTTSPQTTEASPVRNLTPEITFGRGGNALGRVYYQVDNGAWKEIQATSSGAFVLPEGEITASGAHAISVKMDDKAGNISDPVSTVYHVDIDAPVLNRVEMPKSSFLFPSANRAPVMTWDSQDSDVAAIYYSVDGGQYNRVPVDGTKSLTLPETVWGDKTKGRFTISVYAEDTVGNTGPAKTLTYYLKAVDDPEDYLPKDIAVNESYGKRVVTWKLSAYDSTKASYGLHRGDSADFTPSAETLIIEDFDAAALLYIDNEILEAGTYFYKIVVTDLTGDEGAENYVSEAVAYENVVTAEQFSNRLGQKSYLDYLEVGMPNGTIYVEKSSGNLLYTQDDFDVSNSQLEYGMSRAYNSQSERTSMVGRGWTDSYHKEIYTQGENLYFVDSDGSAYFFELQNDGSYICGETKDYVLETTAAGYVIKTKEAVTYTFNRYGQLTETREPNGCTVTNTYDSLGRLQNVKSMESISADKVLIFNYDGDEYQLDYVEDLAHTKYTYQVTDHMLTKVIVTGKDSGSVVFNYAYGTASGRLQAIKDGEGNAYTVSYIGEKAETIAYPDGEKYKLTYTQEMTTTKKLIQIEGTEHTMYTLESVLDPVTGKVLSFTNAAGDETSYEYLSENSFLIKKVTSAKGYESIANGVVTVHQETNVTETAYTYDENDNVETETSSDGTMTTYDYDADNNLMSEVTEKDETVISSDSYTYDENGNVTSNTDEITGTIEICEYEDETNSTYAGNVTRTVVTELVSDVETAGLDGEKTTEAVVSESTYSYEETGEGQTVSSNSQTGTVSSSAIETYDAMGRLVSSVENGITTTNTYDFLGRVIETTVSEEGKADIITLYTYNDNGTLVSESSSIGTTKNYTYDNRNRKISETVSGSDMETRISYTDYGFAANETIHDGISERTEKYTYTESTRNTAGQIICTSYLDISGNTAKEVAGNTITQYTYDKSGNAYATYVTDAQGIKSLLALSLYDADGRNFAQISQPQISDGSYVVGMDSIVTYSSYDEKGNVIRETDGNGVVTTYTYDKENRLTSCNIDDTGDTADITVSHASTETDGQITTITDANGNQKREIQDWNGLTTETADINMHPEEKDDEEDNQTQLSTRTEYDSLGRKSKETFSDESYILYTYDGSSANISKASSYRGGAETPESETTYTYDNADRLISAVVTKEGSNVSATSYTYDAEGKKLTETVSYGLGSAETISYSYDAEGRLTETDYPEASGLEDVTYTYDTWGNLLTVSHDGKTVCEYTYDGLGQLMSMKEYKEPGTASSGYILKTCGYDSQGRCTSIRYLDNGSEDSVLESFVYTYDKNSLILTCRHVNNLPAEDSRIDETRSYTYDSYGQLTESVITDHRNSDAQSVTTYTYDKVGNRTAMTRDGQATAYTYNGLNQLTEADTPEAIITYAYDGRGNQITEYNGTEGITTSHTYAVTGEMTGMTVSSGDTVTLTQENRYNHAGIRISKTEGGVTRRYYYDNGILAYTKDGASVSSANILSGDGDILGSYRGEDYHVYTKDVQNSAESILKEDGSLAAAYSYTDFGETTELTGNEFDNEICYTGAVYDSESELYYMNARYYDPQNGRFISQDTYRGELEDADQWHLYAYCANNPINYVDPSGHKRRGKLPPAGTKLWVCCKTTKQFLREKIAPYFKREHPFSTIANGLVNHAKDSLTDLLWSKYCEKYSKDYILNTVNSANKYYSFLKTSWDIGRFVSDTKMYLIWKKIDKFYKDKLKGSKAKENKKVWYCHQLSFRRQGMSDGFFRPTGTVCLTIGQHGHGKYEKVKRYM